MSINIAFKTLSLVVSDRKLINDKQDTNKIEYNKPVLDNVISIAPFLRRDAGFLLSDKLRGNYDV